MVVNGYTHHVNSSGVKLGKSKMNEHQKRDNKNHHKSRTILQNIISYTKYEKITNKDSTKSIFDSLRMTREGNDHVIETKALTLIQKYEAFKIEEDESIENMFSRFQTLAAGLKVLGKCYITKDHVKKIIRILAKKWGPMVTALKASNNMKKTTLEELVSSLRSHEIELEEDEPQRRKTFVALKSKTNAFQAKAEESEEKFNDEDEFSLLFRRVNHLWKKKQSNFRGYRKEGRSESNSEHHKSGIDTEGAYFECRK